MGEVRLEGIRRKIDETYTIDGVSLTIPDHEFVSFIGPRGSVQLDMLNMLEGKLSPNEGRILVDQKIVFDSEKKINLSRKERKFSYLLCHGTLWYTMDVYHNIMFPLANLLMKRPYHATEMERLSHLADAAKEIEKIYAIIHIERSKPGSEDEIDERIILTFVDEFTLSYTSAKQLYYSIRNAYDDEYSYRLKAFEADCNERAEDELQFILNRSFQVNRDFNITYDNQEIMKNEHVAAEILDRETRRMAKLMRLTDLLRAYPQDLTRIQRLRVNMAEAMILDPEVLLIDEPHLLYDDMTREELLFEIQRLHQLTKKTFVMGTTNVSDALRISDRIFFLKDTKVWQGDSPSQTQLRPRNKTVAEFLTEPKINLFKAKGKKTEKGLHLSLWGDRLSFTFIPSEEDKKVEFKEDDEYLVGIHPHDVHLSPNGHCYGKIDAYFTVSMGILIRIRINEILLTCLVKEPVSLELGDEVRFDIAGDDILVFDIESEELLALGSFN